MLSPFSTFSLLYFTTYSYVHAMIHFYLSELHYPHLFKNAIAFSSSDYLTSLLIIDWFVYFQLHLYICGIIGSTFAFCPQVLTQMLKPWNFPVVRVSCVLHKKPLEPTCIYANEVTVWGPRFPQNGSGHQQDQEIRRSGFSGTSSDPWEGVGAAD